MTIPFDKNLFQAWAEEELMNAMTPAPPKRAGYISVSVYVEGMHVADQIDVLDARKTRQAVVALTDRVIAMLRAREGL